MLSPDNVDRAARHMVERMGEVALAAAVLHAQMAAAAGDRRHLQDWARIAEAAADRLQAQVPPAQVPLS